MLLPVEIESGRPVSSFGRAALAKEEKGLNYGKDGGDGMVGWNPCVRRRGSTFRKDLCTEVVGSVRWLLPVDGCSGDPETIEKMQVSLSWREVGVKTQ
jgi:hypothetical protein